MARRYPPHASPRANSRRGAYRQKPPKVKTCCEVGRSAPGVGFGRESRGRVTSDYEPEEKKCGEEHESEHEAEQPEVAARDVAAAEVDRRGTRRVRRQHA